MKTGKPSDVSDLSKFEDPKFEVLKTMEKRLKFSSANPLDPYDL